MENSGEKRDKFPLLDAAWTTVAAALPSLVTGENERLQAVCAELGDFLNFTGRWDEWLSLSREAERRAAEVKNFRVAGERAYAVGWVQSLRGQAPEVLESAARAETYWAKVEVGVRERAFAIRLRGIGHQLANDLGAAITALREAVELWKTNGDESEEVSYGLNDLACAEQIDQQFEAAERDMREALRIARKIDYQECIVTCMGNLTEMALHREDFFLVR